MFSLTCAQITGGVNNREAGDLRRHRSHYDVIVMDRLSIDCVDQNEYCDYWADVGECTRNPSWMKWFCQKACGFCGSGEWPFNTLRPRQNGRHFADDVFKCNFLNENAWIPIKISLKFVPEGSINNIPALVQIMAWRRPGDKPLFEPMLVRIPTHICVTRHQWVNSLPPWEIWMKF